MNTDIAHQRIQAGDRDWVPVGRRDDRSGGKAPPVKPLFLMATLAVRERQALVQVTMALIDDGAPAPDPRLVLDVPGEVTRPLATPLPFAVLGRADAPFKPPVAAIVARYLANAESGQASHSRSFYA